MDRRQELWEELMGIRGMIAEVQAKSRLLKNRVKQEEQLHPEPTQEFAEEAIRAVRQMKRDLAKYQQRLLQLLDEWRQYGIC
jgi:hypothetical protein